MSRNFSHKDRVQILLQYWELGPQQQLCVPFGFATATEYQEALALVRNKDAAAEKKINNWESRLSNSLRSDLSSANVKKVSEYLVSQLKKPASAPDLASALEGPDAQFFYFLARSDLGSGDHANMWDQARAAEQRVASVGGDTIETPRSGGDKSGDGHLGNSLAPTISSHYVGVKWPDTDGLVQHFAQAYSRTLGGSLPKKHDRKFREHVFFLYRLGLAGIQKRDFWDGAITPRDKKLQVVIRRIPARIYYDDPFEEWLFYEEAYYDSGTGVVYNGAGVIYGFHGGMTLLSRDGTMMPNEDRAYQKKLSLAHFDFRSALAEKQKRDRDCYIGSIAMESDYNPDRDDFFAPTAYRCLLRKAPDETKWDEVKASLGKPGKSATIPIGEHCSRTPDGILDFKDGKLWGRESDLEYHNHFHSWRWYFNRLNINRHVTDLLIACPSIYSRWPDNGIGLPAGPTIAAPQPSRSGVRPQRGRRLGNVQE